MGWQIFELLMNAIECVFAVVLMRRFLEPRYGFLSDAITISAAFALSIVTKGINALPILFFLILLIAMSFIVYKGKWYLGILIPTLYVAMLAISEFIVIGILTVTTHIDITHITDRTGYRIVAGVIAKIILMLSVFLVARKRNQYNTNLHYQYWLALLVVPITSVIAMITLTIIAMQCKRRIK